ncbi:MAG: rane protein, partial [Tardiphaga sp.]|nr:rane protein [Tardiphaga sp.]
MTFTRRQLLASVGGLAATAGLAAFWASRMTSYSGPVSDHFDGTTFFDPDGVPPKTLREVLRWQFGGGRERHTWPDWVENEQADIPPRRVETGVRLSFVGHASWLIQTAGQNILIDPVWSERVSPFSFAGPKRHNAPGIAFDKLPKIDTVLVSHGHYDHLDLPTLSRLAATFNPRVVTPLGNDTTMRSSDSSIRA